MDNPKDRTCTALGAQKNRLHEILILVEQQWLRQAWTNAQTCQSLCCCSLHTQSMDVEEDSDQNDYLPCWQTWLPNEPSFHWWSLVMTVHLHLSVSSQQIWGIFALEDCQNSVTPDLSAENNTRFNHRNNVRSLMPAYQPWLFLDHFGGQIRPLPNSKISKIFPKLWINFPISGKNESKMQLDWFSQLYMYLLLLIRAVAWQRSSTATF